MRGYRAGQYTRINGTDYAPGDVIDAPEAIHEPDVLISAGIIVGADLPDPEPVPDPSTLKRAELNELAAQQGIEAPETLPNKAAVIEAITTPAADAPAIIDVTAFGAKGDGTTDDTAALQAAFNAAPDTAQRDAPAKDAASGDD